MLFHWKVEEKLQITHTKASILVLVSKSWTPIIWIVFKILDGLNPLMVIFDFCFIPSLLVVNSIALPFLSIEAGEYSKRYRWSSACILVGSVEVKDQQCEAWMELEDNKMIHVAMYVIIRKNHKKNYEARKPSMLYCISLTVSHFRY